MSNFTPISDKLSKEEIESFSSMATEGWRYLLNDVKDDAVNADGNPWNLGIVSMIILLKINRGYSIIASKILKRGSYS